MLLLPALTTTSGILAALSSAPIPTSGPVGMSSQRSTIPVSAPSKDQADGRAKHMLVLHVRDQKLSVSKMVVVAANLRGVPPGRPV